MVEKLPKEVFLQTFEYAPRLAICLHVEENDAVLLAQRAIEPNAGSWHYPGSFLLKNESLKNCLQRIAKAELGAEISGKSELLGVFEDLDADPRGHVIDIVYRVKLEGLPQPTPESKVVRFFSELPQNTSFHHDTILKSLGFK